MPLIYRKDVISFTTGTLKREMVIAGTVQARLYVASRTCFGDFSVTLADVLPDGETSVCFCQGIARFAAKDGNAGIGSEARPELLEFDLPPVCLAIGVGHRIRVCVSSGLFPAFEPNPNCPPGLAVAGMTERTVNTVFLGGDASSMIMVPIVHDENKQES